MSLPWIMLHTQLQLPNSLRRWCYFEVFAKDEQKLAALFNSFELEEIKALHWIDDTFGSRTDFRV